MVSFETVQLASFFLLGIVSVLCIVLMIYLFIDWSKIDNTVIKTLIIILGVFSLVFIILCGTQAQKAWDAITDSASTAWDSITLSAKERASKVNKRIELEKKRMYADIAAAAQATGDAIMPYRKKAREAEAEILKLQSDLLRYKEEDKEINKTLMEEIPPPHPEE